MKKIDEIKTEINSEIKAKINPKIKTEINPETNPDINPKINPGTNPEIKTEINPDIKFEIKPVEDVCNLEADPGPCLAYRSRSHNFNRYYFDKNDQKCKTFIFSGCRGKVILFFSYLIKYISNTFV